MNRNESGENQTVFGLAKFREKVLTVLADAYVNNDLAMDEYEKRLHIAHEAKSIEELEHAVYDFPQVETFFQSTEAAPPRTIDASPGFESSRTRHAGSRKWFPIQIGIIPPFMLVDSDYSICGIRMGFILGENVDVFGLDLGFVLRVSGRLFGLQLGFINSANHLNGIQVGFVNRGEKVHGLQLGFINSANHLNGIQVGFVNRGEKVHGLQLGFINKTQVPSGVQFGFLNFSQNRDGKEKCMPVINIGF